MTSFRRYITLGALLMSAVFTVAQPVHASTAKTVGTLTPDVHVYNAAGTLINSFRAYPNNVKVGVHVAIGDVNGDGAREIITAPGTGGGPEVKIFSLDGTFISHFMAYAPTFRGGVNLSVYDLDGDGRAEIVTAPSSGMEPRINVFRADGSLVSTFLAFDTKFTGGVNITTGDFGSKRQPLIITGAGFGGGQVVAYTPNGKYAGLSFRPFGNSLYGVVVANVPVAGARSQLAVAEERLASPTLKVFNLANTTKPVTSFAAFDTKFTGGIQIASADVNADGTTELITALGPGKTPRVKTFLLNGHQLSDTTVYQKNFSAGTYIAADTGLVVTGPRAVGHDGRTDLYRYIQVNLTAQTLSYYENGRLIGFHRVSTGKWSTPTPVGTFTIKNKMPIAYSKPYDLYMEWWMAFTPDGSYGLHALPFWKLANGGRKYEGVGHIGTPVSHGCIRQSDDDAKALYDWATVGTPVIVTR